MIKESMYCYNNKGELVKVPILTKPSKVSVCLQNINVETSEYIAKRISKKFINIYVKSNDKNKMVDSLHVENPKLKELLAVYGIELLETKKMTLGELAKWCKDEKSIKSLLIDFESDKIQIIMFSGSKCEPIDLRIEVI